MTDQPDSTGAPELPDAEARPRRRFRLSLVWLLPIIAAVLGGWLAVRAIHERGPTVRIHFTDAEGLEAGKTKVRLRSVEVGTVKTITLQPNQEVFATVQMEHFAAPFLVKDTRFWIVTPRVGAGGISGLGTILTGAYVGMDVGRSREKATAFVALATQPVVANNERGTEYVLRTYDIGSLTAGAPVYYRHLNVGRISAMNLDSDGKGFTLRCFIEAKFSAYVRTDTRFWHASGIDAAIDSSGIHVQTEALTAILAGGIAFDTPDDADMMPAAAQAQFDLMSNRQQAMKTVEKQVQHFVLYFNESLRGLAPGSAVEFRGINVGEVKSVAVDYEAQRQEFKFPVFVDIYPERIHSHMREGHDATPPDPRALLTTMIERGFRAQLRSSSFLTGQLYVSLDFFPNAAPASAQPELTPMPLPTVTGDAEQIQKSLSSVAKKLDQLPLEHIGRSVDQVVASLDVLLKNVNAELMPELKATLIETHETLSQARDAISGNGAQGDLNRTLQSVGRAADSLRQLADYLEQHPEALVRGKPKDPK